VHFRVCLQYEKYKNIIEQVGKQEIKSSYKSACLDADRTMQQQQNRSFHLSPATEKYYCI